MLRYSTVVAFLLISGISSFAQQQNGFLFASSKTEQISPKQLSEQLTVYKKTELEKVTAIFHWITENIDYRVQMPSKRIARRQVTEEEDTSSILKPLNERVAEIVLKNRLAVCDGYARLFKTLCDYAGIRSEIIVGYVRNQGRNSMRFQTNHSWNAVMIAGEWKLMDPTWASGYVSYGGQFVQQYDSRFFMADPDDLLRTHYPENPFWTLVKDHKPAPEFSEQPMKYFAFHRYNIIGASPTEGKIEIEEGKPVEIEIRSNDKLTNIRASSNPHAEFSGLFPLSPLQNNASIAGNAARSTYMPEVHKPEWLFIILNGDVVMRYRLYYKSH
jgi:transglutaminase/protease-like cytokinesis protein 3